MRVHLLTPDSDPNSPLVYCGAAGALEFTDKPPDVTCADCAIAHVNEVLAEKRPLGLYAVFYDGETRPVAGFVLEQDAHAYAEKHSGGASWEVRHVDIVESPRPS